MYSYIYHLIKFPIDAFCPFIRKLLFVLDVPPPLEGTLNAFKFRVWLQTANPSHRVITLCIIIMHLRRTFRWKYVRQFHHHKADSGDRWPHCERCKKKKKQENVRWKFVYRFSVGRRLWRTHRSAFIWYVILNVIGFPYRRYYSFCQNLWLCHRITARQPHRVRLPSFTQKSTCGTAIPHTTSITICVWNEFECMGAHAISARCAHFST